MSQARKFKRGPITICTLNDSYVLILQLIEIFGWINGFYVYTSTAESLIAMINARHNGSIRPRLYRFNDQRARVHAQHPSVTDIHELKHLHGRGC